MLRGRRQPTLATASRSGRALAPAGAATRPWLPDERASHCARSPKVVRVGQASTAISSGGSPSPPQPSRSKVPNQNKGFRGAAACNNNAHLVHSAAGNRVSKSVPPGSQPLINQHSRRPWPAPNSCRKARREAQPQAATRNAVDRTARFQARPGAWMRPRPCPIRAVSITRSDPISPLPWHPRKPSYPSRPAPAGVEGGALPPAGGRSKEEAACSTRWPAHQRTAPANAEGRPPPRRRGTVPKGGCVAVRAAATKAGLPNQRRLTAKLAAIPR